MYYIGIQSFLTKKVKVKVNELKVLDLKHGLKSFSIYLVSCWSIKF